jgi:hypothetical protein
LITTDTAVVVAALKFVSPVYAPVTECVPTLKFGTVSVATPFVTVPVPNTVAPSLNVTDPVAAVFDIVTVSTTLVPKFAVEGLAPMVAVIAAVFTRTTAAGLVDVA